MVGCTLQKYENSPGFINLCEYVLDGIISAVKPESNNSPALIVLGTPDVTVCIVLSMLFHLTVFPT
jgi:predicted secreted protein